MSRAADGFALLDDRSLAPPSTDRVTVRTAACTVHFLWSKFCVRSEAQRDRLL